MALAWFTRSAFHPGWLARTGEGVPLGNIHIAHGCVRYQPGCPFPHYGGPRRATYNSREVCPEDFAPTNRKLTLRGSAGIPSTSGLLFLLLPRTNPQRPGPLLSSSASPAPRTVVALLLPRAEDALSKSGVAARRRLSRVEGRRWRASLSWGVYQLDH
jgi:hypothetical protein